MENESVLVSVVETQSFQRDASGCMSEEETNTFISHIAANPESGDVIKGTGGIRKVRWAIQTRGNRSGVRIIYYFHDLNMPLFLLAVFKKNEKEDLSAEEKKLLRSLSEELVHNYRPEKESEE